MSARRITSVAVMTAAVALATAAPAVAGTGPSVAAGSTAAACEWVVTWPTAGVYELPTRMNPPLKEKHSGDQVGGGFCMTHFNTSEQEWYVSVTCACAEDDIGWMRHNALRPA